MRMNEKYDRFFDALTVDEVDLEIWRSFLKKESASEIQIFHHTFSGWHSFRSQEAMLMQELERKESKDENHAKWKERGIQILIAIVLLVAGAGINEWFG